MAIVYVVRVYESSGKLGFNGKVTFKDYSFATKDEAVAYRSQLKCQSEIFELEKHD